MRHVLCYMSIKKYSINYAFMLNGVFIEIMYVHSIYSHLY